MHTQFSTIQSFYNSIEKYNINRCRAEFHLIAVMWRIMGTKTGVMVKVDKPCDGAAWEGSFLRTPMRSYRPRLWSVQRDWFCYSTHSSVLTAALISPHPVSLWWPLRQRSKFRLTLHACERATALGRFSLWRILHSSASWSESDSQTYVCTNVVAFCCPLWGDLVARSDLLMKPTTYLWTLPLWKAAAIRSDKRAWMTATKKAVMLCLLLEQSFFNEAPHLPPTPLSEVFFFAAEPFPPETSKRFFKFFCRFLECQCIFSALNLLF